MLTSRIAEGENHNRNRIVTIMVINVCFSWALDPDVIHFKFVWLIYLSYNS